VSVAPCGRPPLNFDDPVQADDEFIQRRLEPLVLVFGVSESATSPDFWQEYYDALSDLPRGAVAYGTKMYVRQADAHFFPKPGPLRALAMEPARYIWAAQKAAAERLAAKRRAELPAPAPDPERPRRLRRRRALFVARFHRLRRRLKATAETLQLGRPHHQRPPIQARVDETGTSAELRDLENARRNGGRGNVAR
jgi:hypothetical protein